MVENYEFLNESDESLAFRKHLVEAVEPMHDKMVVNKFLYIAIATDLDNGDEALTWGSWNRTDGEGLARWDIHGMLTYMGQRLRIQTIDEDID